MNTRSYYTVSGYFPFPTAMLMKDKARPANDESAALLGRLKDGTISDDELTKKFYIRLVSDDIYSPRIWDWSLGGWTVDNVDVPRTIKSQIAG